MAVASRVNMAAAQASQPLRVLVAPNAFKDCLSARAAAKAIERGLSRARPPLVQRSR
jgi:hypothetical protein